MTIRTYTGPLNEVEIPALRVVVTPGGTFDDPLDLLADSPIFPAAKPAKSTTPKEG